MKVKDIVKYAFNSMERHRKRTILTLLGIMIGITAFTSISSLNTGFQQSIETQLTDAFGATTLIITPKTGPTGIPITSFDNDDVEWIRNLPHVETTTGALGKTGNISNADNITIQTTFIGTEFSKLKNIISGIELAEGEIPTDETEKNDSLILGYHNQHYADNERFADIGEEVEVSTAISFRVNGRVIVETIEFTLTLQGTLEETTQSVGMGAGSQLNPNKMAFIPLETLQNQLNISRIHGILSKVDDTDHVDGVADEIRSHFGEDKVDVITSKAILSTVNEILDRIAIFLMAIASVALLVAGFGIMNTMTMSVSERTKEIGILKSIGATNGTILGIFLSEALLMGIAGGILGIGLGYVGGFVLGRFILALMGNPGEFFAEMLVPVLSPMTIGVSFALAVVISVIFAYWPSKRAANYDPVKALRFG